MREAYRRSGVDVTAGYEAVERMKKHVARTARPEATDPLGGFGGMFDVAQLGLRHPVLISGTDGVGTKLLIAQRLGKLDTIGIDAVAMCVNDVVAEGAAPLFFLDYVAVGHNDPARVEAIVAGVAEGCVQAGAALIGGETAEMPDMYAPDEFDLAGFCVGAVEADERISPALVHAGDVLVGLDSSGVHSNGFSLVRQILFKDHAFSLDYRDERLGGRALGETLLAPTIIYVRAALAAKATGGLHGVAHITGGGFPENLPRMLPAGLTYRLDWDAWHVPGIFDVLGEASDLSRENMSGVFNMGLGMVFAVAPDAVDAVVDAVAASGQHAQVVGEVVHE